ncbi:vacuolar protein sorting-associated protein 20-like, partial [Trifolium medium]
LAVEDLPEAPTTVPAEIDEKLDLPDVPTKAPVISDAEVPIKRKVMEEPLEA